MHDTKASTCGTFLNGGGEMGALMRAYDWSATPLGPPAGWPTALKVALRLLLTSNHPMVIWWGPDLIQFYNDGYRQTMGPERHPSALGQRGRECWREAWHIVGAQIEGVMAGHGATWHEDHLVPVTRHGVLEDVWWTYGYSPIEDEQGVQGVLVICNDVTSEHRNRERLQQMNGQLADEVAVRQQAQAALTQQRDQINLALDKSEGHLARQISDWRELHAMATELLGAASLQEQFDVVLRTVASFHRTQQGVISCFNPQLNGLVTASSLGLDASGLRQLACVPSGAGACGTAYQRRQRIIIADTETDPLYEQYRGFAREQGIRALYSTPFFAADGQPLGVLSVYFSEPKTPDERELRLTDICASQIALFVERARAEERLHLEQVRSHRVLQTLKDGFMLMDRDFRVQQINAAGLAMERRPASEIVGRIHWELWPDSDQQPHGQLYQRVMREREPETLKFCFEHAGERRWFDLYAYPYEEEGIAVLYRDVTEHAVAEETLAAVRKESEQRYRLYETILSHSLDLAYVWDLEHRFTYANEVLLRMWGKTWDEAIGRNCLELGYEPWHAEMHSQEIERIKATKQTIRGEVPFEGAFGRRIYEYILVPVLGPDGKVEAVAGTTRDMTDRKRIEEELQRLAADLAESNRRKTEFLATLAHELRNPLAPIRTGLDLMRLSQHAPATLAKAQGMMDRQLNQLVRLIDDLMDISRIDSGKIVLKMERVDLQAIVSNAVEAVLPAIESARHKLEIALPDRPVFLDADATRLAQVVSNLLTNAAKYTPSGGQIGLRAELDGATVRLTVSDNGIGIPADALGHVFDMFSQVSKNIGRAQGGLGIGLALVRSLVTMHGGSVHAHSDGDGKGSEFIVELPAVGTDRDASASGQRPGTAHAAAARRRVLIADDNEDALSMLAALFEVIGHRVDTAHDGTHSLAMAGTNAYDLIILDIGMPGLTGYEVVAKLRTMDHLRDSKFVALTGWGTDGDRARAKAAGFDAHLTKPAGMEEISGLLAALS